MQHQKAKHFKCGHCPRKLNTAGGLAVHIQQVHKLDPEPIENALDGRRGYEVEIFGMEGVPPPDSAAYKRKKEQELGLPVGYFGNKANETKPGMGGPGGTHKRNYENRVYTFEELRGMLETHRQLMGREDDNKMDTSVEVSGAVLNAAPQTYMASSGVPGMPPGMGMPPLSMTGPPGAPPMPLPMGMPFPPPGLPGMPPFPPGGGQMPFFPPPPGMLPPGVLPPPGFSLPPPEALGGKPPPSALAPGGLPPPAAALPSISKPPTGMVGPSGASNSNIGSPNKKPMIGSRSLSGAGAMPTTFDAVAAGLKEGTQLEWIDMNYSPLERRAEDPKYSQGHGGDDTEMADGTNASAERAQRRARAQDFLD